MFDQLFASHAKILWFVAAFVSGLALNLTPCVYPMIPVTVAFFSGQASGRIGYAVWLGVCYVFGIAVMYAALGMAAAKTGALLGSWLQQPIVLVGVAVLIVALALSLFGVYELRPPARLLQRLGEAKLGWLGAVGMGLAVGVVAAPCIGPFVLGLLTFVSRLADPVLGFGLFLVMGIGMGLPYLVLGVWANRVSQLPKAGVWMVWIKKALGIVLLGLALYFVRPLVEAGVFRWLMVAGGIGAGVYLGWLEPSRLKGRLLWMRRVVGIACVGAALALVPARSGQAGPSIPWQPYQPAKLADATQQQRPVLIDVYADWCVPCVELDHVTFRHPKVIARLSQFVTLRIDATRDLPPEAEALLNKYDVYGVPTVLVFDAHGQERSDLRVNGFVTPEELLEQLKSLAPSS